MTAIDVLHDLPRIAPFLSGDSLRVRPAYERPKARRIMLASESFRRHMSNEGNQLQEGLHQAGYELWGRYYPNDEVDVRAILDKTCPGIVIVQDKREWDSSRDGCFEKGRDFTHCEALADRPDIFKVTVLKDAQNDSSYQRMFHEAIGVHAVICYYHPAIVTALCGWLDESDLVRTYHSLDPAEVPSCSPQPRKGTVMGGMVAKWAYPLRHRIAAHAESLGVDVIPHPGYGANGHSTSQFLRTLSQYKVCVATASIFGYALRKIMEGTACGCRVVTDLPAWDCLPAIDDNLVRVSPDIGVDELKALLRELEETYDPERQAYFAERALDFYDYRATCKRLAEDIEAKR